MDGLMRIDILFVIFLMNCLKVVFFLYSLETYDFSKTIDKVFNMLDDIFKFVGDESMIPIVTNNVANYKAAGEMLM